MMARTSQDFDVFQEPSIIISEKDTESDYLDSTKRQLLPESNGAFVGVGEHLRACPEAMTFTLRC